MRDLKGKNILFFSAHFFGYSNAICTAMERMGALVDYFDERPANTFFVKAMIRIRPELLNNYIKRYYDEIIEKTKNVSYDYVFFIKAEAVTTDSLKKLREHHPNAEFVLYLWDSFANFKNGTQKLKLFDKAYSFDRDDCLKYKMAFQPLFFLNEYCKIKNCTHVKDIDVLFIGTMHSDRYLFVKKIEKMIIGYGLKRYYYLFFMSPILYYKMKLKNEFMKGTRKSDFKFKSISQSEILSFFERSSCVIDIQHPKQTGLTMRTLEVLGAGLKLITTNKDIVNYDFYNPNNIVVVDRSNPKIPKEFFEGQYLDVPTDIYEKYSIDSWLLEIFSNNTI